jgi:hypothetical protein
MIRQFLARTLLWSSVIIACGCAQKEEDKFVEPTDTVPLEKPVAGQEGKPSVDD